MTQSRKGRPRKQPVHDAQIERGMDTVIDIDAVDKILDDIRYLLRTILRPAIQHRNTYHETLRHQPA